MKPDWAERIQRSRKREYDKGWADCEARIIKLLEKTITDSDDYYSPGETAGIYAAIALIKGEQNGN